VPTRPLRYWHLVKIAGGDGVSAGRLCIAERILHYLAGINYLDERLQPLIRKLASPAFLPESQQEAAAKIVQLVRQCDGAVPVVQLWGNDADGKLDVSAFATSELGMDCYVLGGADLPGTVEEVELLARLWSREAILLNGILLIDCGSDVPSQAVRRFLLKAGGVVLLAVAEPVTGEREQISCYIEKPVQAEQLQLWLAALGEHSERYRSALQTVAAEFRFSRRDIERVTCELVRQPETGRSAEKDLWRQCLRAHGRQMGSLAQHIEVKASWDDLVLPPAQKAILRQIASHLRHRTKVYQEWGFAGKSTRGLGLSTLFAGESGTGKTMAAEVLAGEVDLDLYRIDLSAVVSKYIGETEKNLARIFDMAEDGGFILLFDEADALFGKRSEVRDSHDRYANIEVSYLLQRMELYRGLAILTTNQKKSLDSAFHRRLRFVVNFPFPGRGEREAIWRSIFPAATPRGSLDYTKLAQLQATGGNIRNIALGAAFGAAEEGCAVQMHHILSAAQVEAGKRERALSEAETRGWV